MEAIVISVIIFIVAIIWASDLENERGDDSDGLT